MSTDGFGSAPAPVFRRARGRMRPLCRGCRRAPQRARIGTFPSAPPGLPGSSFLRRKWARELDYRLIKELWAFHENRIAVRFVYEYHDDSSNWFRAHGNEQWEFDPEGYMQRREASINDVPIREQDRKFRWAQGPRPADHPGLTQLGL